MPKIYSEQQKTEIKQKLKYEANILMKEKGVKKTTIDELVKKVNIPKGTFYLFYSCKEELLYEVSQDYHTQIDSFLKEGMKQINPLSTKEEKIEILSSLLLEAVKKTFSSCLSVLLNPESMNLILSKLPEETLQKHLNEQDTLLSESQIDIKTLKSAFMMIIFGEMYKKQTGEENWETSLHLLIKGLVLQMMK